MGRGFQFKIKKNRQFDTIKKLIGEWDYRWKAYCAEFAVEAARIGLRRVRKKAPTRKEMGGVYKGAMLAVNVTNVDKSPIAMMLDGRDAKTEGLKSVEKASAVIFKSKLVDLKTRDPNTTLLYVKIKRNVKKVEQATIILQRNNPWTSDTLPWVPPEREATVVYVDSKTGTVQQVRRQKTRKLDDIILKLRAAGIRMSGVKQSSEVAKLKVRANITKTALMFEFGIGQRPKPHWRPMVRYMRKKGVLQIASHPKLIRTMTDPRYNQWKKLGILDESIKKADVEEFNEFQNKIT